MKMGLSCACWGDSKLSIGVKYSCVALKGTEIRADNTWNKGEQNTYMCPSYMNSAGSGLG